MLSKKHKIGRVVVLTLAGLGVIQLFMHQIEMLLVTAAIIGLIYYLYRKPPQWLIRMSDPGRSYSPVKKKRSKRDPKRRRRFQIIDGNRKHSDK
ncbi:hypothetical protein [Melghirimyces algeriensis]|uniref:Uncharacterized protein n=1 Tax=Melghirimyces algeriensis TaxID=910412 RepID=A0A521AXD6_9BACL|nr:hypothetical protein [Melghirimyces algeriensis]SMO39498.1 hypothetical protein SAMN06264849_101410 [Melghirimyces algeriensis]